MVTAMDNEIPLSKAELEIAETCVDKPALDYSETSFSHSPMTSNDALEIAIRHTRIPKIEQEILCMVSSGAVYSLRINGNISTRESTYLKDKGFMVTYYPPENKEFSNTTLIQW